MKKDIFGCLFSVIFVPYGTSDIYFVSDIAFRSDIRLRRVEGTNIISLKPKVSISLLIYQKYYSNGVGISLMNSASKLFAFFNCLRAFCKKLF